MNSIEKLTELFARLPGIGPRQARRIVYFLLTQNRNTLEQFADAFKNLKGTTTQCSDCMRFFPTENRSVTLCPICANPNRDNASLMIVEKDVDLENIERAGVFNGKYFVLGGTISLFEKEPMAKTYVEKIPNLIKKNSTKEIVLALSATPAGEETENALQELLTDCACTVTRLGRGLSTGSELEYSDRETIKNAFERRV